MDPELIAPVQVEAYAGTTYPERPLCLRWRGTWRRVLAVEHQYREPHRICFIVALEPLPDEQRRDIRLRLCYDYANNAWQAKALGGEAN